MMKIYQFFRLIRFTNLLVIALTMLVVEMYLNRFPKSLLLKFNPKRIQLFKNHFESFLELSGLFWPLLLSTILIAASGYIINDYFDVKADRVNKPNRLIIDKYIKRRWAMVFHWAFSSLGLLIALYIGFVVQSIWVPIIAFLSVNLLWFYSLYYKRRPLIGNLIVAFLIGVLPIHVLMINSPPFYKYWPAHSVLEQFVEYYVVVGFLSIFAFLVNLYRELVKDIQDIKGDLILNAKTFPIKYGIKNTKWLITILIILIKVVMFYYIKYVLSKAGFVLPLPYSHGSLYEQANPFIFYFLFFIFVSWVIIFISFIILLSSNRKRSYKTVSLMIKIAMLFGLLIPLFS